MTATFTPVGHILGVCAIRLEYNGRSITFSGDVGRLNNAVMMPPEPLADTDNLVLESTYGAEDLVELEVEEASAVVVIGKFKGGGFGLFLALAVGGPNLVFSFF